MSFPWMLCVCTDYGNDLSVEDQIGNPIVESNHDSWEAEPVPVLTLPSPSVWRMCLCLGSMRLASALVLLLQLLIAQRMWSLVTFVFSDCPCNSQKNESFNMEMLVMQIFECLDISSRCHWKINNGTQSSPLFDIIQNCFYIWSCS